MFDFLPLPNPLWLQTYVAQPIADKFSLPTLPAHLHEIIFAASLYEFVLVVVSPIVSNYFFPVSYNKLSKRSRFNWDIHVVSFVQSIIVCTLALYDVVNCEQRPLMTWRERVFGYTGGEALIQAFAAGYFIWDLYICTRYISMFGVGMLAHAISALNVYAWGFRPFVNFYSPSFILYELSSPFLNIHWFCDKLEMTGSTVQFVNGICLLFSFFCARIIYGSYISVSMFYDIYRALIFYRQNPYTPPLEKSTFAMEAKLTSQEVIKYAPATAYIPVLLWTSYLASNATLHILNFYWFGQMIKALRKRFDPPLGTKGVGEKEEEPEVKTEVNEQGRKTVKVESVETEVRRRPTAKRVESDMPPPT